MTWVFFPPAMMTYDDKRQKTIAWDLTPSPEAAREPGGPKEALGWLSRQPELEARKGELSTSAGAASSIVLPAGHLLVALGPRGIPLPQRSRL